MPSIKVIAGPTASGKSAHALAMAKHCDGVVINADSMQVYRDLPILTAQPSLEEQGNIPHKLYSVLDGSHYFNAAQWAEMAREEIEQCFENARTPILVGGTGFYLKALMEGLSPIPDIPREIRHFTEQLQEMTGNPGFHALLEARDPKSAEKIDPMNTQRLIHAWEVLEATGKPLSYWQSLPKKTPPEEWRFEVILLLPEREALYRNIEKRFGDMLDKNVMEEVIALHNRIEAKEVAADATIIVSHGYRALRDHHLGIKTLDEARDSAILDTRRYAKRQYTWFKNQIKEERNIVSVTYLEN